MDFTRAATTPEFREGDGIRHPRRADAPRACQLNSEITARLPPIPTNILQKIWSKAGKSGCQRLPKIDLFATICPHCLALDYKPEKALIPFIYRNFIGVLSGSRVRNRTSTQRLGKPMRLTTKSLRKKTKSGCKGYLFPGPNPARADAWQTNAATYGTWPVS